MPLQNRVLPTGEIVADPGRGLMTGNRGCLHQAGRRELGASPVAVADVDQLRAATGGHGGGDVMPPGRWTALFFLDEATALAAGHRPCGYCRRGDYRAFTAAWRAARGLGRAPMAREMDLVLHAERVSRARRQVTRPGPAGELPGGVMYPGRRPYRAVSRRRPAAVVVGRVRRARAGRRAGRGGRADAAVHRGRHRGRLPAAGAPHRTGRRPGRRGARPPAPVTAAVTQ